MQTKLIKQLNEILKQFPKYWDNETLKRNQVINDIKARDTYLIKALISDEKIKSLYSTEIDGVLIFDFHSLESLLQYKEYWHDSFTKYRNSVGLTSEGKYLNYNSDVVLDFPFKDCVLEGGMTKEDTGKNEVYYNEVIARDEIDRLFSPKVFTNTKRYSKDGIDENITDFNDDDNLIIKGNNLIALHSLKQRYAGKIKLIYIDPPYNTGNDGFKYNDRFNHSTWLTFMKNRLEAARELLSDDGVIFVQIDNSPNNKNESSELGYLLVLMDFVFDRKNYLTNFIWKKKGNASNTQSLIGTITESIIAYSKNFEKLRLNLQEFNRKYQFLENNKPFNIEHPVKTNEGQYERKTMQFEIVTPQGNFYPPEGKRWTIGKEKAMQIVKEEKYIIENNLFKIKKYPEDYVNNESKLYNNLLMEHGSLKSAKNELQSLGFSREIFDSPKPEKLIESLLKIATNKNDIVLDFHLGSGTTAAVAHKMNRRYIGIEQMDYINEVTVPRLVKVIEGEQGGISKDVNWQGGGSFVYTELKEFNQQYIHQIHQAENTTELQTILEQMKTTAHLNYQVELDKILNTEYELDGIFRLVSFSELDLHQQKQLLIELLDKNQLYINADDMNDETLQVAAHEKAFTHSFYRKD